MTISRHGCPDTNRGIVGYEDGSDSDAAMCNSILLAGYEIS